MKSRSFATLIIAVLALAVALPLVPARGSTGNIHINSLTSPSPHVTIQLGGSLNLYFGGVTWSGGQVNLYLSSDGYASISTEDTSYGPTFQVNQIQNMTGSTTVSGYSVGLNWINGTVPTSLGVPGGNYYVKAFDGSTSAVAVTDTYFTIWATFEVVPTWGPGQAAITLKGYGLPANDYANFSWSCTSPSATGTIANLVPADSVGYVEYSMLAPDLLQAGTNSTYSTIVFNMVVNGTGQSLNVNFIEFYRGLKQVKGVTGMMATAPALYGNNTDFSTYEVNVTVLGDLIIAGYYFHPGTLTFLWDGATSIGTATANATHGFFNTTVSVPITSIGPHIVTISDGKCIFNVSINVIPTLILSPDTGPVGTVVTATGYGFPASDGTLYNVTLSWDYVDACTSPPVGGVVLGYIPTNTQGQFVTTFIVPLTVGGAHVVTATANSTPATIATDTFTVTATLAVSPSSPTNDGTLVTVSGTGLDYYGWYDLWINGKDWYTSDGWAEVGGGWTVFFAGNCTGYFSLEFYVDASFNPGTYAAVLYRLENPYELPVIDSHVMFTVVGESEVLTKLNDISDMLTGLDSFVRSDSTEIHSLLTSIQSAITAAKTAVQADISGLGDQLSSIATSASNAASRADAAATSATNAATYAQAAETAAEGAQSATSGISLAVYGAVILALVAALASIFAVITLQRKVA